MRDLDNDDTVTFLWGHSSAGRALQWHCRGQEFDPPWLHHFRISPPIMINIRSSARQTLNLIAIFIEENLPEVEVEPGEEEVLITDSQDQNYLLNYHGVTQQIWYSSAMSGAHHFALTDQGVWHCTRSKNTLYEVLSRELSHLCQRDVIIPDA